jgi:hypothetical protein
MSAPEPAPAPWLAGVDVSAGQAAGLIRAQFPELAAATVTRLATGWDNTAFVVDDRWLFRFPRREIAVPGVRRELAVLPRLAPALPLPIPDPRFAGHPARDYPWPFFGAALLPGTELADAGLPDEQRVAAATGIGRFLAALHDPALAARLGAGLPVDPMRRASAVLRARRAREILGRLAARGTWPGDPAVTALVDRGEALAGRDGDVPPGPDLPGGAEPVICHGDLHVRHVLVDSAGAASGVIDWGDLCLGDPVIDSPARPGPGCWPPTAGRCPRTRSWPPGCWPCRWAPPWPSTRPTTTAPRCCARAWPGCAGPRRARAEPGAPPR